MIAVRHGAERGRSRFDWLDSRHTFSFAEYYDARHIGFRTLRVINEDRVAPGRGFGTHTHRDMEIVTWVLSGALQHRDSLGNGSVIRPGEVQRMSAGRGVAHSEFNASDDDPVHFLQIWILPAAHDLPASYEQQNVPADELRPPAASDRGAGRARRRRDDPSGRHHPRHAARARRAGGARTGARASRVGAGRERRAHPRRRGAPGR
jgi:redox-sensitive bicupin YhaK (pirin superfamily)